MSPATVRSTREDPRVRSLLRSGRARLAGVLVLALVPALAVVLVVGDEDDTLETAGGETVTTSASESTTTSSSSTTTRPTTTSASTTTVAPIGTTPPPTSPPPPTTAAPPPATAPAAPATLDRPAVIAFARAHPPGGPVPYMYSGSPGEVGSTAVDERGDDGDGDLFSAELVRDNQGTFRLFHVGEDATSAWWVEIDSSSGGCEGTDLMAIQWSAGEPPRGAVVRIPSCDPSSWSVVGATGNPGYPNPLVDFLGSTFGDPTSFGWRAGLLGSPADTTADIAPSSGFTSFAR